MWIIFSLVWIPTSNAEHRFDDLELEPNSITDRNGVEIPVSMVSYNSALKIFQYLQSQSDIPYWNITGGCHAKAHKLAKIVEDIGVITVKVWIHGDLRVYRNDQIDGYASWNYHVAPAVKVDYRNRKSLWILDPSLAKQPLPIDQWTNLIEKKRYHLSITTRFQFDPATDEITLEFTKTPSKDQEVSSSDLVEWDPRSLERAESILEGLAQQKPMPLEILPELEP